MRLWFAPGVGWVKYSTGRAAAGPGWSGSCSATSSSPPGPGRKSELPGRPLPAAGAGGPAGRGAAGILLGPGGLSPAELFGEGGRPILEMRVLRVLLAAAVAGAGRRRGHLPGHPAQLAGRPLRAGRLQRRRAGRGALHRRRAGRTRALGAWGVPLAAFAGSALAVALVWRLALVAGRIPRMTLLLAGVVVGYLLGGVLLFIVSIAGVERLHDVMFWLLGSLRASDPGLVTAVWVLAALGTGRDLAAGARPGPPGLGEEQAAHWAWPPSAPSACFSCWGVC